MALLALAACQPPPRPFQSDVPPPETVALLAPRASSGVLIAPLQGVPPGAGRRLGEMLADELQKLDVPASARTSNAQSYILHGQAEVRDSPPNEVEIVIAYSLTDPKGIGVGTTRAVERVPATAWREESEIALSRLSRRLAQRVEAMVRGTPPPPEPGQAAAQRGPARVVLMPIEPAPGDSAISVARAMRTALFRNNVAVMREPAEDTFQVVGSIRLKELGTRQEVAIEWSVLHPQGKVLGNVNQGNVVPKGQLSGQWGEIATAVAEGGAQGIVQILRSVRPEQAGQTAK